MWLILAGEGRRIGENISEDRTFELDFKEKGDVCYKGQATAVANTEWLGVQCMCGLERGLVGDVVEGASSTPFAATSWATCRSLLPPPHLSEKRWSHLLKLFLLLNPPREPEGSFLDPCIAPQAYLYYSTFHIKFWAESRKWVFLKICVL